jgi:hypothetical protein
VRLPWGFGPATGGTGEAAVVVAGLLACGGWTALGPPAWARRAAGHRRLRGPG